MPSRGDLDLGRLPFFLGPSAFDSKARFRKSRQLSVSALQHLLHGRPQRDECSTRLARRADRKKACSPIPVPSSRTLSWMLATPPWSLPWLAQGQEFVMIGFLAAGQGVGKIDGIFEIIQFGQGTPAEAGSKTAWYPELSKIISSSPSLLKSAIFNFYPRDGAGKRESASFSASISSR